MPIEDAELWCDAWELEAERLGLPKDREYWTVGSAWIAEQRAASRRSTDWPSITRGETGP
jgi:hypothetical protein